MIIISGTGRSGTTYIHHVLTDLGLDMGVHERSSGKDGAVGGYRVLGRLGKGRLITQLREPLETVASSIGSANQPDYPELGIRRADYAQVADYLIRCYFEMNRYLITKSIFSYSLEELNAGLVSHKLIELFKMDCSVADFDAALERNRQPRKMNKRPRKPAPNLVYNTYYHQSKHLYDKYRNRHLH